MREMMYLHALLTLQLSISLRSLSQTHAGVCVLASQKFVLGQSDVARKQA